MSGQWEVVGKKKDKNAKLPAGKSAKDVRKKQLPHQPKLEDVLPISQVKNLYAAANNKENQKPKNKPTENGVKKPEKKKEKHVEAPKPKPPKSIESALNSIDAEEFEKLFEKTKVLFPGAPIVWLKELVTFLNQKVPVEVPDVVFTNRNETYPMGIIPSAIKSVMDKALTAAGSSNCQHFFYISLTTMATDMNKGVPSLGHKFFLQYLAHKDPKIVVADLSKYTVIKNSYMNRQNIGLSILWVLGQAGVKDFHMGLQVFQEIMLPLIEMKNYSRYVVKYLVDLFKRHKTVSLTKEQYLSILDVIFTNNKNVPADLQGELKAVLPTLQKQLFTQNNDKFHTFIDSFLKKIQLSENKSIKNELCEAIIVCLEKDKAGFGSWSKSYTKYLGASTYLLKYIEISWNKIRTRLNVKVFKDVLNMFAVSNEELLLKKRKDDTLLEGVNTIKKLNSKLARKRSSGFPVKTLLLLLIAAASAVIFFDVRQNGSWAKSRTFQTAKDIGLYDYSLKAVDRSKQGINWAKEKLEETFPDYYKTTAIYLEPYGDLVSDFYLIAQNSFHEVSRIVGEKYPVFIESIESYAPGLLEQSQQAIKSIWSTSAVYFNRSVDFLKKEVFTGQLSPENVQRVFLEAFNTTQQKATEYYHWLYEKVQTTIK